MTLAAYVRSPSSNQVIFEEKTVKSKDLLNAQSSQHEEILEMIARRKRKRSALKVRNDHIIRLSKSGIKDQKEIAKMSSLVGGKITTHQYLDKGVLKKMIAKKCDSMFPNQEKSEK